MHRSGQTLAFTEFTGPSTPLGLKIPACLTVNINKLTCSRHISPSYSLKSTLKLFRVMILLLIIQNGRPLSGRGFRPHCSSCVSTFVLAPYKFAYILTV